MTAESGRNYLQEVKDLLAGGDDPNRHASLRRALERHELLPYLFEFSMMEGRLRLGLSLQAERGGKDIPESLRQEHQRLFESACREVGDRFVAFGDAPAAWPYYRAAGLKEPMKNAIEAFLAAGRDEDPRWGMRLDALIQLAFYEGLHPVAGYRLILKFRGTCDGITTFEREFPHGREIREECARLLVTQLHDELVAALRRSFEAHGEPVPPDSAPILAWVEGREWLFRGRVYHIDDSHLQSVLRIATTIEDRPALELAVDLVDYGMQLPPLDPRRQQPPFDDFYRDHRVFLRALLGQDTELALAHFRRKLSENPPPDPPPASQGRPHPGPREAKQFPAQILSFLLARCGYPAEAIDVYLDRLVDVPPPLAVAPPIVGLCEKAGDPGRLREYAERRQDLLPWVAAFLLEERQAAQVR